MGTPTLPLKSQPSVATRLPQCAFQTPPRHTSSSHRHLSPIGAPTRPPSILPSRTSNIRSRPAAHSALSEHPCGAHQTHAASYHQLERRPLASSPGGGRHRPPQVGGRCPQGSDDPLSDLTVSDSGNAWSQTASRRREGRCHLRPRKGDQLHALSPRSAGRCRPEAGVPSRPRASSPSALRASAPPCGAVPTGGRRSYRFLSARLGDHHCFAVANPPGAPWRSECRRAPCLDLCPDGWPGWKPRQRVSASERPV